jgi:aerotaxis receptor
MALIASGRERPFTADELLICGTDRDGRIRTANEVFVRVSGYSLEELAGADGDLLRHPGMPRAVGRARSAVAYTRQLAKDGAQFWLMSLSVPLPDGTLILAFKPSAESFAAARDAYADVRDAEVVVEDRDPRRRELGIAAGLERLSSRFGDFGAAMRAAFVAEVAARPSTRSGAGPVAEAALALLDGLDRADEQLTRHDTLSASLQRKSRFLVELAEEIRLFALNAILSAYRVADSAAIGAVAELLKNRSDIAAPEILSLGREIGTTVDLLADARFHVASARVAVEAVLFEASPALVDAIESMTSETWQAMTDLEAALDGLAVVSASVEEHLKTFRFLELQGRIEAARATDTEHVRVLFEEIGRQVRAAGAELIEISALGARRGRWSAPAGAGVDALRAAVRGG